MAEGLSLKKNIAWNSAGSIVRLGCNYLVTIAVVRLSHGFDAAGALSLAMSVSNLVAPFADFRLRTVQVTDVRGEHSSGEYVGLRLLTSALAFVVGVVYAILTCSLDAVPAIVAYLVASLAANFIEGLHAIDQRHLRPLQLHLGDLLQAHDSGDGVAGVLVGAAPLPADVRVEVGEVVVADDQFAAGRAVDRAGVSGGLQFDQRQFVGDILADFAVAPGREHAAVEIGGNAVVFGLDQQRFFGGAGEFPPPFEHLLERIGLVERKHRRGVPDLAGAGDPGGVNPGEQRVPGVDPPQGAEQFVVADVGNLRFAELPVLPVVVFDQFLEFFPIQLFRIEVDEIQIRHGAFPG